jgi:hypothetical protein
MLEFNASIIGCELPIGLGVVFVTVSLPGSSFGLEPLSASNAPVEAL